MVGDVDFKMFDIPVLCSVFMPAAFRYYADSLTSPMPDSIKEYYIEWCRVIPSVLKQRQFYKYLGKIGTELIQFLAREEFAKRCVASNLDIGFQALYNLVRNTETVNYLIDKRQQTGNLSFVDVGAGFCPLSAALQTEYNLSDVYVIDKQPVLDAYGTIAYTVGGKVPQGMTWNGAQDKIKTHQIDTVVSMGLFHYLPLSEQIKRLRFINEYCQNFLIEVKCNCKRNVKKPAFFNSDAFMQLRALTEIDKEVESKTRKKTLDYYRHFYELNKKQFLHKEFSIFLSR